MKLFSRNVAAVAAATVLGVTAGGSAWAGSTSGSTPGSTSTQGASASANTGADTSAGAKAGRGLGAFGKRVLHGEVVLRTRKGTVTADIARGTVSAIDGTHVSVRSTDGVTTTFGIDAQTKARSAGSPIALSDVHVGDRVGVLGIRAGAGGPVARLVRKLAAKDTAGTTG
jgi:hypothetical protein